MEDPTPEQVEAPEGGCGPWEAHAGASSWQDLWREEPMPEQHTHPHTLDAVHGEMLNVVMYNLPYKSVSKGNCVHEDWSMGSKQRDPVLAVVVTDDDLYAAVILGDPAAIYCWV
ncbi:AN1-type zinc finger protein 5-like [Grus japonensis]|uniref:AN1-type zinc finger protein 5-like n=1 Tax=Grus japonensis TaxID=30415 RepID=A0ABC9WT46_GRUJA